MKASGASPSAPLTPEVACLGRGYAYLLRELSRIQPKVPLYIHAQNATVTVQTPIEDQGVNTLAKQFRKQFFGCNVGATSQAFFPVHNLNITVEPRKMTLVLAPPGHGKSTLLKLLSGQQTPTSGSLTFNGLTPKQSAAQGLMVNTLVQYVEQVDIHVPYLTVRETLQSAVDHSFDPTSFGDTLSDQDRQSLITAHRYKVDMLLKLLDLEECADTLVGNDLIRGLSGGQRKRLTMGEALCSDARAFFLDESTSGLDAATAAEMFMAMRNWVDYMDGACVAALLQPGLEIFHLFDDLVLLREGEIVYNGPREQVLPYFESIGLVCPPEQEEAVADWLLEVLTNPSRTYAKQMQHKWSPRYVPLQTDSASSQANKPLNPDGTPIKSLVQRASSSASAPSLTSTHQLHVAFTQSSLCSEYTQHAKETLQSCRIDVDTLHPMTRQQYGDKFSHSFARHMAINIRRLRLLRWRDKSSAMFRLFQAIVMGFVIGTLFYDLPDDKYTTRVALVNYVMSTLAFSSMVELVHTMSSKQTLLKHYRYRLYPVGSYVMADLLLCFPISLLETLVFATPIYWMTGFVHDAWRFVLFGAIVLAINLSMTALFRLVAFVADRSEVAETLSGPVVGVIMLFGGFLLAREKVPDWFIWLYWISPFSWSNRAAVISEFKSSRFDDLMTVVKNHTSGELLLQRRGDVYAEVWGFYMDDHYVWLGVVYQLVFVAIISFLAVFALKRSRLEINRGTSRTAKQDHGPSQHPSQGGVGLKRMGSTSKSKLKMEVKSESESPVKLQNTPLMTPLPPVSISSSPLLSLPLLSPADSSSMYSPTSSAPLTPTTPIDTNARNLPSTVSMSTAQRLLTPRQPEQILVSPDGGDGHGGSDDGGKKMQMNLSVNITPAPSSSSDGNRSLSPSPNSSPTPSPHSMQLPHFRYGESDLSVSATPNRSPAVSMSSSGALEVPMGSRMASHSVSQSMVMAGSLDGRVASHSVSTVRFYDSRPVSRAGMLPPLHPQLSSSSSSSSASASASVQGVLPSSSSSSASYSSSSSDSRTNPSTLTRPTHNVRFRSAVDMEVFSSEDEGAQQSPSHQQSNHFHQSNQSSSGDSASVGVSGGVRGSGGQEEKAIEMVSLSSRSMNNIKPRLRDFHSMSYRIRSVLPFTPVTLAFKDICFSVPNSGGGGRKDDSEHDKILLRHINGFARPGTLTALMGPSGAGKTTLLDILSSRKTQGSITGQIFVNGHLKNPDTFSRVSGYVEQQDHHMTTDTVYETLMLSAHLRLPSSVSARQRKEMVEDVLRLLELNDVRDRCVGGGEGGLSPGQLKRVTMGVELVANPSVLFLDEPTTALDSTTALHIVKVIRQIALTGRAVVCTIHQPSAEVFDQFDRLLLLQSGGFPVYFGDVTAVEPFMSAIPGVIARPPELNLAVWMLDVIGSSLTPGGARQTVAIDFMRRKASIASGEEAKDRGSNSSDSSNDSFERPGSSHKPTPSISPSPSSPAPVSLHNHDRLKTDAFNKHYLSSRLYMQNDLELDVASSVSAKDLSEAGYARSFWVQYFHVQWRFFRSYWRNVPFNYSRFLVSFGPSVFLGLLWFQINDSDMIGFNSKMSGMIMSTLFNVVVSCSPQMHVLFHDRPAFYREQSARTYSSFAYSTSMLLIEAIYVAAASLVFVTPLYLLMGMDYTFTAFFQYYFGHFLLHLSLSYIAQLHIAVFPSVPSAQVLFDLILVIVFLFGGVFIAGPQIPLAWKWLFDINPVRYCLQMMYISQFNCGSDCAPLTVVVGSGTVTQTATEYLRTAYGIDFDGYWWPSVGFFMIYLGTTHVLMALALRFLRHIKR